MDLHQPLRPLVEGEHRQGDEEEAGLLPPVGARFAAAGSGGRCYPSLVLPSSMVGGILPQRPDAHRRRAPRRAPSGRRRRSRARPPPRRSRRSWVIERWMRATPSAAARAAATSWRRTPGAPPAARTTSTWRNAVPCAQPVPSALSTASLAAKRPARCWSRATPPQVGLAVVADARDGALAVALEQARDARHLDEVEADADDAHACTLAAHPCAFPANASCAAATTAGRQPRSWKRRMPAAPAAPAAATQRQLGAGRCRRARAPARRGRSPRRARRAPPARPCRARRRPARR